MNDRGDMLFHGLYRSWYTNGQLHHERTYVDDKVHGLQRVWHENGELRYEFYHHHGTQYESKEECMEALIANRDW